MKYNYTMTFRFKKQQNVFQLQPSQRHYDITLSIYFWRQNITASLCTQWALFEASTLRCLLAPQIC